MLYIFELSNPPDIEPIRKHQPAHLGRIIGLMPADRWPSMAKLQVICKFMVENLGFESAESAKILRDEYFQSGSAAGV